MKKIALVTALAFSLSGCAAIQNTLGSSATNDAMQAARIAITTYADIYQPAVITYGKLPNCQPEVVSYVCKYPATLEKLKAADLAVTTSIVAARGVLEGTATDAGQIVAAISAISQAEAAIAASGALVTTQ